MQSDSPLRLKQVMELTHFSKSEIYRRVRAGTFPAQRRLSHKLAVWSRNEVAAWVDECLHA